MEALRTIALSADQRSDYEELSKALQVMNPELVIQKQSLLDLVLKEHLSWFHTAPPPDLIIASYSDYFRDLKAVADLKKNPKYQYVPIVLFLSEKTENITGKLLQFGVAEVFRHPGDQNELAHQLCTIVEHQVHH
jgi:PleD family two-component response regulator